MSDTIGGSVVTADQLAGVGTRLLAKIIDGAIAFVCMLPFIIGGGISAVMAAAQSGADPDTVDPTGMIVAMMGSLSISGLLLLVYAVVQIWMLTKDGQTIGKKLTHIRIVKLETGQNGGFVPNVLMRAVVNGIINNFTGGLYGLVDALFIFRQDRRCLHDLIAGTTVVKSA